GVGEWGRCVVPAAQLAVEKANYIAGAFGKVVRLLTEVATSPDDADKKATKLVRQGGAKTLLGGGDDRLSGALQAASTREGINFSNSMSRYEAVRGGPG